MLNGRAAAPDLPRPSDHGHLARSAVALKLHADIRGAVEGGDRFLELIDQIGHDWRRAAGLTKYGPGHIAQHTIERLTTGQANGEEKIGG